MAVLSWNEIRIRAKQFVEQWKDACYERGQSQTFYNEFFEVFGKRRRDVAVYERAVKKLNNHQGFVDLFWPGMLLVEQKSAGEKLQIAESQADEYLFALPENERPRYILVSDFQQFILTDLELQTKYEFSLEELPEKILLFDFIAGRRQQVCKEQDQVNIEAALKMSSLHKALEDSGYHGHDLEVFLIRAMFCLFADDTGIFEQDALLNYIRDRTAEDGSDLGAKLTELFQVLDTPKDKRQHNLDEDLAEFDYINGKLFAESIKIPSFDAEMRHLFLDCCYFNWSKVSPAIFGSLFQSVMLPEKQRQDGAHYTSEKNILKVIEPLFLNDLRDEFETIKNGPTSQRKSKLKAFQEKLGTLTFFDPACGCGNFLIVAYRELRLLEMEVLNLLYPKDKNGERQGVIDISLLSKIDVDQFYGIEINEFPVRIAEAALWLTDHQMNMRLADMFGIAYVRLPLRTAAHIHHANALQVDWKEILPPKKCSYILGNPPFSGYHMQSAEQKKDMVNVLKGIKKAGVLDYVATWFVCTSQYIQHTPIQAAFVSTNSITQGEQVSILWKPLYEEYRIKINFAHRTFKWTLGNTHEKKLQTSAVYVVIIGFATFDKPTKTIFEYDTPVAEPYLIQAQNINPYLSDRATIFILNRSKPLYPVPIMKYGNKPTDGGYFLMLDEEKIAFLENEPKAKKFIKPFINAKEYLYGQKKWVLWLKDADPTEYSKLPLVMERIQKVKEYRSKSKKVATQKLPYHHLFEYTMQPSSNYLLIPRTTSENRDYIPIGFFTKKDIVGDSCMSIPSATLYHLGILQSKMHMVWVKTVCGRLGSGYRYSAEIVYNNFPWPKDLPEKHKKKIEAAAQKVLDARAVWPNSTLAELYNPLTMPENLLKAHHALDTLVDRAYQKQPFQSEMERIQFLFALYQEYIDKEKTEQSIKVEKKPIIRKTKPKKIPKHTPIDDSLPKQKTIYYTLKELTKPICGSLKEHPLNYTRMIKPVEKHISHIKNTLRHAA